MKDSKELVTKIEIDEKPISCAGTNNNMEIIMKIIFFFFFI